MTASSSNADVHTAHPVPSVSRTDLTDAQLEVFGRAFRGVSGTMNITPNGVNGAARIVATTRPSNLGAHVYLRLDDLECVLTTFEVLDARNGQFLVQFSGFVCTPDTATINA
jgi:hypothetical protein